MVRLLVLCFLLVSTVAAQQKMQKKQSVLQKIMKCGFEPRTILDVGANRGEWTQMTMRTFPKAKYLMIEADAQHTNELKAVGKPFEIALVAEFEKDVVFYAVQSAGGTGNSVFKENSHIPKDEIKRRAYTIDSIVKKHNFDNVDFIKLDIQGSELNALRGANETLRNVDIIQMELSVMNYNQGAPTFAETIAYMDNIGFAFYQTLENMFDGRHVLIQIDAIFARKTSKYWKRECTSYPPPESW